eukprot:4108610-Amphidinium_carterae.1
MVASTKAGQLIQALRWAMPALHCFKVPKCSFLYCLEKFCLPMRHGRSAPDILNVNLPLPHTGKVWCVQKECAAAWGGHI